MTETRRSPSLKNITRLDYTRTHGYWVRFEGKSPVSKMFSDGVFGGKRKALKAAQTFRDEWIKSHDVTRRKGSYAPPGPGKITKRYCFQRKSWTLVWEAYIKVRPGPGHAITRYSINKWGSREAKRLCEVWLEQKRKEQAKAYGLSAPRKTARGVKKAS